jgi:peptidoglycan hydrolase CwlO-like protein
MNDLTHTITDLKTKVEKLVSLHGQLKVDNEQLAAAKTALEKTIDEQKAVIETLQTNNKELIENKTQEQNKIITDTKLKINELVQEIDSCIALLK